MFFFGDLNYRCDGIENQEFRDILNGDIRVGQLVGIYDQLSQCLGTEGWLREFNEGEINFKPTFKFDVGTDNYGIFL